MKFVYILFLKTCVFMAQQSLSSLVWDASLDFPIENVKVYIDNTTISVLSNTNGKFTIQLPVEQKNLQLYHKDYLPKSISLPLENKDTIFLESKNELDEVLVVSSNKDWEEHYKVFIKNFLGESQFAKNCKILSPKKSLRFSFKNNIFKAVAIAPIIIKNPSLGYTIEYYLDEFTINYTTKRQLSLGSTSFSEKKGSKTKTKKWKKNRSIAYNGSFQHFIRSLYHGNYNEQGFAIRNLTRVPNPNYPTEKEISENREYTKLAGLNIQDPIIHSFFKRMKEHKYKDYVDKNEIDLDSLLFQNETRKILNFKNYLHIVYKNEMESKEYKVHFLKKYSASETPQSSLLYIHAKPLSIYENGWVSPSDNVFVEGYWSFEKIGDLMPLDYSP